MFEVDCELARSLVIECRCFGQIQGLIDLVIHHYKLELATEDSTVAD